MILKLKRNFDVLDATRLRLDRDVHVSILAGCHKVVRIPNPYPRGETDFIVLEGTKVGACEQFWRMFPEEVLIEE